MAKSVKMLLAGAGFMGKVHLEAAKSIDSVEYIGIVDTNENSAKRLADEFNLPYFKDFTAALEKTKPAAADICVPTPYHLPLVKIAALCGINILLEKPIALNAEDAGKIKSIVQEHNIRLMIAQVLRFWPEYVCARQLAIGGKYGRILSIDCKRLSSPPGWNSWMMLPDVGGGAAVDLQIHDMDFVLQLMGGPPTAIDAVGRIEQGAINAVFNRLIYPTSIPVTVEASYLMPPSYPFRMYFKIECEDAVLEMDFWRPKGERLKVFPKTGEVFAPELPKLDAYGEEIRYFSQKLLSYESFEAVPLDDSITALQMCLASQRSCRLNKIIDLKNNRS